MKKLALKTSLIVALVYGTVIAAIVYIFVPDMVTDPAELERVNQAFKSTDFILNAVTGYLILNSVIVGITLFLAFLLRLGETKKDDQLPHSKW